LCNGGEKIIVAIICFAKDFPEQRIAGAHSLLLPQQEKRLGEILQSRAHDRYCNVRREETAARRTSYFAITATQRCGDGRRILGLAAAVISD
jgi:hypothetical protein